jgi:hypothetical protein
MIIYKLIGSAGLVASGIWFYFIREKFQKRKELQFSAYIKLISYIKNQIECYMLPIDAIIAECDIELLSECGSVNRASTLVDFLDNSTFYIDEDVYYEDIKRNNSENDYTCSRAHKSTFNGCGQECD